MVYTIEMLTEKILTSEKSNYNLDKIRQAYELADRAHKGQVRSSGEPYVSHPVAVAYILLEMGMDTDSIVAALLHDVVEDTEIALEYLVRKFGAEVAHMVDGVTKINYVPLKTDGVDNIKRSPTTKEEMDAENTRKILMKMSEDPRVIVVKLADRLHNMRTLACRPPDKQRKTSAETMNFYAPIAHRLGMGNIKEEMEDLALRYLDPYAFKEIEEHLQLQKERREKFIEDTKTQLYERFGDIEPRPLIEGRVKGLYSIYKKVFVNGKSFGEVHDIYALRIIVKRQVDCYNVLGVLHDIYRIIDKRFKDYISVPKSNRYQSLHTTLIGREGIPFEVQVRTTEMHRTAQYGIAAHWKYKEGIKENVKIDGETHYAWVRQLVEQQQESDDSEYIVEAIKNDLASDEVYVFTPKGEPRALALGSTVIDFAYAIHTQVGNKMTGAKVSGRMVSFNYELRTGDVVEIMTTNSESYGPNRNWLSIAKTSEAKAKIRAWFKRERREENIAEGKTQLEQKFKASGIPVDEKYITSVAQRQRFDSVENFYAAIGYGGVSLTKIMQRVKEDYARLMKEQPELNIEEIVQKGVERGQSSGVIVEGIDNCLVRFAQCCNPLPGDEITGFITRGYGVSIHKKDCVNVNVLPANKDRWLGAHWAASDNAAYRATIDIVAENRNALIADVTVAIATNKLPISEVNAHYLKNGNANVIVTIEVMSVEQLENIKVKLKKIPGVISVERTGKM